MTPHNRHNPGGVDVKLTIRTPVLPGLFRLLRTTGNRLSQKGHPLFSLLSLSFAPPKESNQRKGVRKRKPFLFFAYCAMPFPAPKNRNGSRLFRVAIAPIESERCFLTCICLAMRLLINCGKREVSSSNNPLVM